MPHVALSIRGPWWWFMVHGAFRKDIENRSWSTPFRGEVLIHASKGLTRAEYEDGCEFARECGALEVPEFKDLLRGGIVGRCRIGDCVARSSSPWFVGPWGFVIEDAQSVPFMPCRGALGFFYPELP